jgi:hypothetical protein
MLLVHLLAEAAAVTHLGGGGPELASEVYFEEIEDGVECDEELLVGVLLDVLNEEVVGGEVGGKLVQVHFEGEGHEQPYLLLVHITMLNYNHFMPEIAYYVLM